MSAESREEIRAELERLANENGGRISPDLVVKAARDKDSPLHPHFTWSNAEAAEKQRLHEARELIRTVRVTTIVNERVHRTIAYIRDPSARSEQQGYIATAVLRTDADLARAAIVDEFGRAASAMKRALEVADALNLRNEVQAQIDGISALRDRAEQRV